MNWLNQNAKSLEAVSSIMTAFIAIVEVFGVKYQIDTTRYIECEQAQTCS